jgi:hypothetical protein
VALSVLSDAEKLALPLEVVESGALDSAIAEQDPA